MQNDSELDMKFEQALASYADPSSAGDSRTLTMLVLAVIEKKRQRQRQRWWLGLAFATPALACVVLIVLLAQPRFRPKIQAVPIFHPAFPAASLTEAPHDERVYLPARHSRARNLVKLDRFPTPAPLTEQERLLVQFAERTSLNTQQQIAEARKKSAVPLHIAELTIPKLDSTNQPK